jgi:hypothetical protein
LSGLASYTWCLLLKMMLFCLPLQVLEELAISVQQNLISKLPFCAFNGGNDVFVDVGNKSIGLDALMRHLDCYPYEVGIAAAREASCHALRWSFVNAYGPWGWGLGAQPTGRRLETADVAKALLQQNEASMPCDDLKPLCRWMAGVNGVS